MLFEVNKKDYTYNVNYKSYDVNEEDVCNEWTDGFEKLHKDRYRKRIQGSFDIVFVTETEYLAFIADLKAASTKNVLRAKFYVGGANATVNEIDVYYRLRTTKREKISNNYMLTKLSMEIEQV